MNAQNRSPVISLIGRPNVGKSTIFNRIMRQSFKAMVYDLPGVTRDRHYSIATLEDKTGEKTRDVILVDTGGFYPEKIETEEKLGKKKTAEPFFNIMAEHAKLAIDESDLVLMIVDIREGLIPFDKTICDFIRTTKKPMWLIVNKFDTDKQWGEEADFYSLGIEEENFFMVSAEHARGLTTLRERLFDFVDAFELDETHEIQKGIKPNHDVVGNVAIVGAPNAGKSTLLNQFIGANRALVSDVAGTTVDPIEGYFDLYFGGASEHMTARKDQYRKSDFELVEEMEEFTDDITEEQILAFNQMPKDLQSSDDDYDDDEELSSEGFSENDSDDDYFSLDDLSERLDPEFEPASLPDEFQEGSETETKFNPFRSIKLVDTAGIRRQKSVYGFIEEQSVYRSLKAISEADVIIYMVDVQTGITHQDRRLCDIALEKGKSLIICLNKVDLISATMNDPMKKRDWLLDLRSKIPWLAYCELITISAKKGKHLNSLKESLRKTLLIRNQKVTTGKLNKTLTSLVDKFPVMVDKKKGTRFKVKYASMLKATPPTFLLFSNKSKGIPPNFRKYLTSGLRREFQMVNTPIHLIFRTTTDIEKRMKRAKKD